MHLTQGLLTISLDLPGHAGLEMLSGAPRAVDKRQSQWALSRLRLPANKATCIGVHVLLRFMHAKNDVLKMG